MRRPVKLDTLTLHCRGLGLPEPVREFYFARPRKFRADYAWPDQRLLLEVDGGTWLPGGGRHNRGAGFLLDMTKLNLATLAGWRVLRVTPAQVQDGTAVQLVELALIRRGSVNTEVRFAELLQKYSTRERRRRRAIAEVP